jgi:hypothetical protein
MNQRYTPSSKIIRSCASVAAIVIGATLVCSVALGLTGEEPSTLLASALVLTLPTQTEVG